MSKQLHGRAHWHTVSGPIGPCCVEDVPNLPWRATLWGQPPSINHLYDVAWKVDRSGRRYKGRVKNKVAQKYHDDAVLVLRAAKPSRWEPPGQVRIHYRLHLHRDIDADNVMKVVNDAIATATGINDSRFLPCVQSKVSGLSLKEARIEVEVQSLPSSEPEPWTPSQTRS